MIYSPLQSTPNADAVHRSASAYKTAYENEFLSFQGAQHHAFYKIFLAEGIETHHRQRGDDNQGVFQYICQALTAFQQFWVDIHALSHLVGNEDFPQEERKGIFVPVTQVQEGVEISIPMTNGIIEGKNGNAGAGKRQDHAEK